MLLLLALHLTIHFLKRFYIYPTSCLNTRKSLNTMNSYLALCIVVPTDIYHARTKKAMVNYSALKLELS